MYMYIYVCVNLYTCKLFYRCVSRNEQTNETHTKRKNSCIIHSTCVNSGTRKQTKRESCTCRARAFLQFTWPRLQCTTNCVAGKKSQKEACYQIKLCNWTVGLTIENLWSALLRARSCSTPRKTRCLYTHMHPHNHTHTHPPTHTHTHTHTHAHAHTHTSIRTHTHKHTHTNAHTHTHAYTQ